MNDEIAAMVAAAGLTLLVQNESPGRDREANWLPAPKGDFCVYLRLYRPKAEALDGRWTAPKLTRVAVPVTPDTYIRAETDRQFGEVVGMAGGFNRLYHFRKPTPQAGSADPLPPLRWDLTSLKTLTTQYEKDGAAYGSYKGMMGARGKVDEKTRHIAAAAAWGLFPERDATYLNYSGNHDINFGHKATYKVPDNDAFWSITVYGKDLCGDVPNRLDVTDGWNFLMRVYRPGASVLDGTYQLPRPEPLK